MPAQTADVETKTWVRSGVLRATYRLQLTPNFTMHDAAEVVPYLAALGVSHVFCSPVLQAAAGSTHGYDVVDHSAVNPELGGDEGLAALRSAVEQHGLALMIDIVPNHMAVGPRANRQWWDVLRLGRTSRFADWFDIDWDASDGKVLVPVLGGTVQEELSAGSLRIADGADGPELAYYDHRLPLAPESLDSLDSPGSGVDLAATAALLDEQHYRLADWHASAQELNYRRFFDIDTLAGLRVEDDAVFDATHARILQMVADGTVEALRLDHPDGLRDPAGYFRRLRTATGGCWTVVEKILEPGEDLPATWACDGTTGYDHMAMAGGLFVDPHAKEVLESGFAAFTGERRSYDEIARASKRDVLAEVLAADVRRVTANAVAVLDADANGPVDPDDVRRAVVALATHFDVYRTYVDRGPASAADAAVVHRAAAAARIEPGVSAATVDGLTAALLAEPIRSDDADGRAAEFRARFQQFTGPVMAKSVEDTTFYRYVPLVSLNEVGSHPGHFGVGVDDYHRHARHIAEHWPRSMNASTTHDTKRSEDVRSRISLLSEMPERWVSVVDEWRGINAGAWHGVEPDPTMELLLYQTMVGAHPLPADRAVAYMEKASREAKLRTSWLGPDPAFDAALARFTAEVAEHGPFLEALGQFCEPLLVPGRMASLAMVVLKLTAPGVADIYQGCETWTDSLVDPDNRRRVDYAARRQLLETVTSDPTPPTVELGADPAGAAKLWLTHALLDLRARRPASFEGAEADYRPLTVSGAAARSVVAAGRGDDVVSVVGVRPLRLARDGWGDTAVELPPGRWVDIVERRPAQGVARLADHAARYGATVFERSA